jgi:protein-disulfide isomerase
MKQNKIIYTYGLVLVLIVAIFGIGTIFMTKKQAPKKVVTSTTKTENIDTTKLPFDTSKVDLVVDDTTPQPSRMVNSKAPFDSAGDIASKIQNVTDAKVNIELYEDFECTFCLQYTNNISKLLENYGDKINLVIKHFPLADNINSLKAAEAYECAKEQNKGWEMHDKIFEEANKNNMNVETWKSTAQNLGLDTAIFDECIDSDKFASKIAEDGAEAKIKKIKGAPSTVINNEILKGAVSYEVLDEVVKKYL